MTTPTAAGRGAGTRSPRAFMVYLIARAIDDAALTCHDDPSALAEEALTVVERELRGRIGERHGMFALLPAPDEG